MVGHPGRIDGPGDVPHRATRLWPGDQLGRTQQDLESLKKTHPHLRYQDYLSQSGSVINMRTDMPPFNDVRVRRAISHAIDRQALIEAVWGRGAPTAAVSRGLVEWSVPIDQLGAGAKYYQYDPKEARRLLAEAGFPKGFKTQLTVTSGLGRDLVDDAQLVQRFLKEVGIEAELEDPGVRRVRGHDCTGEVRGPDADAPRHHLGTGWPAVSRLCLRLIPERGPRS